MSIKTAGIFFLCQRWLRDQALMQVLGTRAELLEAAAQSLDRHLNCVALACRSNLSLFSDVGPLETIAENKKERSRQ